MKAIFLGTPNAAIPALEALAEIAQLEAIFTQPDRARGRSKTPVPSPVKRIAVARGWPVYQATSAAELSGMITQLPTVDVGLVVAFGMILDPVALSSPTRGMINLHFSRLPRWRGAAPVERAILAGDTQIAATLMVMEAGLDTGPVLAAAETPIAAGESAGVITDRLAELGAGLVRRIVPEWISGGIAAVPQPAVGATYARKLTTAEARLSLEETSESLLAKVRAFNPRPGAYAMWRGERIKVWEARAVSDTHRHQPPGTLALVDDVLFLHTGTGVIELTSIQPAGKPAMPGSAWARGRHSGLGTFE